MVDRSPTTYGSAHDLPSFVEMKQTLAAMKVFTLVVSRKQRAAVVELERDVNALLDLVDDFYKALGDRHWIYTDSLPTGAVRSALDGARDQDAAEGTAAR